MGKAIRPFCWPQNFVPWMLSAPVPGLYTCIKSWKNCIKSNIEEIFFNLATNDQSDNMLLLTSKFRPKGLSAPAPGLYTCIKSWKKMYKIRLQWVIFFFICSKWPKWQEVSVTSKFCPLGLSAPDLQLYRLIKSWKDVYKVRSWSDSF